MLIMVFVGEALPIVVRTIVFGLGIVGIIAPLHLENLLKTPEAARTRKAFVITFVTMAVVIVAIILLDNSFVSGDSLLLGMEPATTFLVFGITFVPFALVIYWLLDFEKAIVPPEKEKRIKSLVTEGKEDSNG